MEQGNQTNKFQHYLDELRHFEQQGSELDVQEFENWKKKVLNDLPEGYRIRFSRLSFYEEWETVSSDIPF